MPLLWHNSARTMTKALCIFTTLLGNRSTTERLIEIFNRLEGVETTYVLLEREDFRRFAAPRWARATDAWESQYVARQKVKAAAVGPFDILVVQTWEFVTAFQSLAKRVPAAVLVDSIPATMDAQLRQRGQGGWKRTLASQVHDIPFARAVRNFEYFLPMGSDCAHSLHTRYGVPQDRCEITLAPQDLEFWKPAAKREALPRRGAGGLRLLFVGNDFERKGGEILLRMYRSHLAEFCSLTILSNDPCLENTILPEGVTWRKGMNREGVLGLCRQSDLFVFPTQQDYMPQVLAEALAAGVPCIANDVGGIKDLVIDGRTGYLMAREAPMEAWVRQIRELASNAPKLDELSRGARSFAEQNLGMDRFQTLIAKVAGRLIAKASGSGDSR